MTKTHPKIGLSLFQGAVRVMAKDLIRTRHQVEKFYKLKSQLQGVSLRIQVQFESLPSSLCIFFITEKLLSTSLHVCISDGK